MKTLKLCCALVLSVFFLEVGYARDSFEPFEDPSLSNPLESLRRVSRMMMRLKKEKIGDKTELRNLQNILEERLAKTLLTIEKESKQNSQGNGSGRGKDSSGSGQKSQSPQSNGQTRDNNPGQKSQSDQNQEKGEHENENNKGNKKPDVKDRENKDYDKRKNSDSEKWGHLPPKMRGELNTNLERDVPVEIEEDMKEFIKRINELK